MWVCVCGGGMGVVFLFCFVCLHVCFGLLFLCCCCFKKVNGKTKVTSDFQLYFIKTIIPIYK